MRSSWVWLVGVVASERCAIVPEAIVPAEKVGSAMRCKELLVGGMQATGSTLTYQLLRAVSELGNTSVVVRKGHYGDPRALGACVVATYRDFRDVVCSHARRDPRGFRQCPSCTPVELEERVRGVVNHLFPAQGARLRQFDRGGAILLRYESFVDCPERVVSAFARWLDIDVSAQAARRLADEWSLAANKARSEAVGSSFRRYDKETHIHGYHISQGGHSRAWRTCLTPEVLAYVEARVTPELLRDYGYSTAGSGEPF